MKVKKEVTLIDANMLLNHLQKRRDDCRTADAKINDKIHPLSYQYSTAAGTFDEIMDFITHARVSTFDIELEIPAGEE